VEVGFLLQTTSWLVTLCLNSGFDINLTAFEAVRKGFGGRPTVVGVASPWEKRVARTKRLPIQGLTMTRNGPLLYPGLRKVADGGACGGRAKRDRHVVPEF